MIVQIIILTAAISIAHMPGGSFSSPDIPNEESTAYVVEMPKKETPTEPETTEPEEDIPEEPFHPRPYTVNGALMPIEWQHYLYDQLNARGIGWFFGWAQCQIYGESRFNQWAANPNGLDKGLCQFRETYWSYWAAQIGWPGASIWDPYAQIAVYSWMMSNYLASSGYDVGRALSMYYLGVDDYSEEYVNYIFGFYNTLAVIW